MKRLLILCTCLVFNVFSLFSNTTFTFTRGKESRTFTTKLYRQETKVLFSVTQNEDGKLFCKTPPFISIKTKNNFFIGELRFANLTKAAISPYNTDYVEYAGFANITEVITPSLVPTYSGFAKSFEHADIALMTPLLNPASPLGFVVNASNDVVYLSAVKISANQKMQKKIKKQYQVNWTDNAHPVDRLYLLIGGNSTYDLGPINIQTSSFTDGIFDSDNGYYGVLGWNLRAGAKSCYVELYNRINGKKATDQYQTAYGINAIVRKQLTMSAGCEYQLYPLPIYGGTSRQNNIAFSYSLEYGPARLKAKHSLNIEESTGHSGTSEFYFSIRTPEINQNSILANANIILIRTESEPIVVSKFSVKLQDQASKLEFIGKKILLTLNISVPLNNDYMKISVTQDHVVTLSFTKTHL